MKSVVLTHSLSIDVVMYINCLQILILLFAKLKTIIIVSVGKSNAFIESEMRLHMQLCGSKHL